MSGMDNLHIEYSDVEQLFMDLMYINAELSTVALGVGKIDSIMNETFEKGAVREGTLDHGDNVPLIDHITNMSSVAGILAQYVDSAHNAMASIDQKVANTVIKAIMEDYGVDQQTAATAYEKAKSGEQATLKKEQGFTRATPLQANQSASFQKSVAIYGGTFAVASASGQVASSIQQKGNAAEKKPVFSESKGAVSSKVVAGTILKNQTEQPSTGTLENQTSSEQTLKENGNLKEKTTTGGEKDVIAKGLEKSKSIYGENFVSKLNTLRKEVK